MSKLKFQRKPIEHTPNPATIKTPKKFRVITAATEINETGSEIASNKLKKKNTSSTEVGI